MRIPEWAGLERHFCRAGVPPALRCGCDAHFALQSLQLRPNFQPVETRAGADGVRKPDGAVSRRAGKILELRPLALRKGILELDHVIQVGLRGEVENHLGPAKRLRGSEAQRRRLQDGVDDPIDGIEHYPLALRASQQR